MQNQDAVSIYQLALDKLQCLDSKTYLQVISKCPLLCLDTSLCKGLQEATVDTRTLTGRLKSFTALLDEVITETSAATKPRRILSSFKAARKKKAAAGQLLDVAEALQVILSTLAKHHISNQQLTELRTDAKAIVTPPPDNNCRIEEEDPRLHVELEQPSAVSVTSKPGSSVPARGTRHQTSTPCSAGHEDPKIVQTPVTPVENQHESTFATAASAAEAKGDLCGPGVPEVASDGYDVKAVPPLQLALVSQSMDDTCFQLTDAASSIITSRCSTDDSDCSPNSTTMPPQSPCQPGWRRPQVPKDWARTKANRISSSLNSQREGLGCGAILENETMCFRDGSELISEPVNRPGFQCADVRVGQHSSARETDGFFTARSHFSPPRSTALHHRRLDTVIMQTRSCRSNMKQDSGQQAWPNSSHYSGQVTNVRGLADIDGMHSTAADTLGSHAQGQEYNCPVSPTLTKDQDGCGSAEQESMLSPRERRHTFATFAAKGASKTCLQKSVDPWQQICDLWERLTGQTLNNVDDAAPIPCTQFVTKLCEYFLGRTPSDDERACIMDVQNPYGYKTILFSDFVECIQYLGPIYSMGIEADSGQERDPQPDNMLDRFFKSVINQQTHKVEPWFRPDMSEDEKVALVEQASPGNFIVKCSRFHAYFEGTVSLFIRNTGQGHAIQPTSEMILPPKLLQDRFETLKEAVQALRHFGALRCAAGQSHIERRRFTDASPQHTDIGPSKGFMWGPHAPPKDIRTSEPAYPAQVPKLSLKTSHALTDRTLPLRSREQEWPTDWQYSFAARLLGKSPRDYHSNLEEMSDRGQAGLEDSSQQTWVPCQNSWRVHLWDQTKALPPSGQGTPECSPCKSSLVPSNQSSPVHHTGILDNVAIASCSIANEQPNWSRTPTRVNPCHSPSTMWQPHHSAPTAERPLMSSGHHRAALSKQQLSTRTVHYGEETTSRLSTEISSPAHMAPDFSCPEDASKLMSPNRKTLRKNAPQHIQKVSGDGGYFTLPMKAAFGHAPAEANGLKINTEQFSLTGGLNAGQSDSLKTSPPRISRGAGFVFKLPVINGHRSTLNSAQDTSGQTGQAEDLPDSLSRDVPESSSVDRCHGSSETLPALGRSASSCFLPSCPSDAGHLRTPPCIADASEDPSDAPNVTPMAADMQHKTVADLADELSPIPSNEPYVVEGRQQELMVYMPKYENDSDDETLRAQSGDESSDSRNASESEGEDADVCGSSHTKMPVKTFARQPQDSCEGCAIPHPASASYSDSENKDSRAWVR